MAVSKIAVSLPSQVVAQIEAVRQETGRSRSDVVREAVEAYLTQRQEAADAEAYRRGYELFPETEEEEGVLDRMSMEFFAQEAWDWTPEGSEDAAPEGKAK